MQAAIASAFNAFPAEARAGLMALRARIFEVAAATPGVGPVSEELRWGQPAYLTPETGSGSTIRLGVPKSARFALFVHCRTSLISDFQLLTGAAWPVEGNRAVLFSEVSETDDPAIRALIRNALTYHRHPARSTG